MCALCLCVLSPQAAIVGVVLVLPGGGATTAASPSSPPPPGPPPAPPAPIPATAVAATNIALAGTYLTNFGSYITVNDGTWYTVASYGTSMYHIHAFEGSYIIAQNSANNSYNAGQWSKFEFHATSGGGYGYCQSVYNAATANAAYNTDTSSIYNAADASAGCNGFGHTTMTPYSMPAAGKFLDNWGSYVTVNAGMWYSVSSSGSASMYRVEAYGPNWILAQNAATNAWNPNMWSLFRFHTVGSGYGFCQIIYNGNSASDTILGDVSAYNASDAAAGCNGFGHSTMAPYTTPMIGTWTTNFGSNLTVTASAWTSVSSYGTSTYRIEAFGADYILAQNSATAAYNPSLWSLFRFHPTTGGSYGFCQIIYNGATAPAALVGDVSAYNASNAASGCNGFSHTIASP